MRTRSFSRQGGRPSISSTTLVRTSRNFKWWRDVEAEHTVFLSFRELLWVCEWMEKASRTKGVFWKKRQEKRRAVMVAKERTRSGSFLRVVVSGKGRSGAACFPEVAELDGWVLMAEKIHRFILERSPEKGKTFKSYKEAAAIPPWRDLDLLVSDTSKFSDVDFSVDEKSCKGPLNFLARCLVGRVGDLECPIPDRVEIQWWVDLRWKTTGGVRVVDMNGKDFLFEFPSESEALRILREKQWVFNQEPIFLDRWDVVGCCHREGRKPRVAWVRALGLPLHLWGSAVFREIGRKCGGFIKVDEFKEARRDLRWARILVKYSNKMPVCVKIGVGSRIFIVPIGNNSFLSATVVWG